MSIEDFDVHEFQLEVGMRDITKEHTTLILHLPAFCIYSVFLISQSEK